MSLMIDNFDWCAWNVVQYIGNRGAKVRVVRNDKITTLERVDALARFCTCQDA